MVQVKVLLFGIVRQIVGAKELDIELPDPPSVSNLISRLKEKHPELKDLSSVMVAVNNEYASSEKTLSYDDEIAIIPPVSGG